MWAAGTRACDDVSGQAVYRKPVPAAYLVPRPVENGYLVNAAPPVVTGYPMTVPAPATRAVYSPVPRPSVSQPSAGYQVFRPVLPISGTPSAVYYGRGVLGQPKLYVSGQPVRNVLRYLTP